MVKHNKIKLAVIISIISIIITILSLIFSIYLGMKNIEYQNSIKVIQTNSQKIQEGNINFQENYQKITLAENSITDMMNSCKEINNPGINQNLKLLTDARTALINNDYNTVTNSLNSININKICKAQTINNSVYIEIGILAFIWLLLIITLIKVIIKN
jgi:hypothetical protein